MTYLVTGGTGLVGSRICRQLIDQKDRVIAYDIRPDYDMLDLVFEKTQKRQLSVIEGDIVDFDFLMKIIQENDVDTVIHTAAMLGDANKQNPRWATKVNVEGTINIFEAARLLKLKKVVSASSNAIFPVNFPAELPKEYKLDDIVGRPWALYGAAKFFGENASDFYFEEFGTDITSVRYGAILFGAGQISGHSGTIVRELILKPALGEPTIVHDGDTMLEWLYAEDVARATILATRVKRSRTKTAYNIGGFEHTIKELFDYIKSLLPEAQMELLPGTLGVPSYNFDRTATERDLGFSPRISTQEAIKDIINSIHKKRRVPLV
jgi:nucleoside-diphosphate-sugar epimerase